MRLVLPSALIAFVQFAVIAEAKPPVIWRWEPAVATEAMPGDPDDVAIWVHPADPSLSLVIATCKASVPAGAVVVFDLRGKIVQTIAGLDRPNNVDVRQKVTLDGRMLDLVAVTERGRRALTMFTLDARTRRLTQLAAAPVFEGEPGDAGVPMGIALYRRARDGALYAIVSRKTGPTDGYLWQYRVTAGPTLKYVRKFGRFSGDGEIEAVVADDANGFVYYADERAGLRKYYADPDHPQADKELATFGTSGYRGDREGLAIYATTERSGYLISTDQVDGASRFLLYRREATPPDPHNHGDVMAVIEPPAVDATDGIEATAVPLGPTFPNGLLVTMNSRERNFFFFAWTGPGAPK